MLFPFERFRFTIKVSSLMVLPPYKGAVWENKYLSMGGLAFAIAAIVGMLVCMPYWKAIKYIP